MKTFKKLLSFVMMAVMAISLATVPALAGDDDDSSKTTPYTITINNTTAGHTYEAYQVFKGTLSTDGSTLASIEWGSGVNSSNLLSALVQDNALQHKKVDEEGNAVKNESGETVYEADFTETMTAAEVAEVMTTWKDDSEKAQEFAKVVADNLSTLTASTNTQITTKEGKTVYQITVEESGYYFVKDADNSISETDAYTSYILQVVKNVNVDPKSDVPTSEKKVKDENDSTGTYTTDTSVEDDEKKKWIDSADYDIGDSVPFKLSATVSNAYSYYTVYPMTFHDKEEEGLTFDATSVVVKVNGTVIPEEYKYTNDDGVENTITYYTITESTTESPLSDDDTFEISFPDLKKITKDAKGKDLTIKGKDVITVEYSSKLNINANLGSLGNKNTMHITYSNNPNDEQGGENGKTPDDTVIVFTYKVEIDKFDENKKPLNGAEFTLYKFVKAEDENAKRVVEYKDVKGTWEVVELTKSDNSYVKKTTDEESGEEKEETVTVKDSIFTATGIDDGYYKIVETKTPDTYNKIDDIYFEVTADHDIVSGNPALTELRATALKADGTTDDSSSAASFSTTQQLDTGDTSKVVSNYTGLETGIVNKKGSTLPSTGGIGTTIFYVVGGIMVVGAAIILVTKKRMSNDAK